MTVWIISDKETERPAIARAFASPEAAERALLRMVSWVANEQAVRDQFETIPIEVEV
jgi:hypothetical protein